MALCNGSGNKVLGRASIGYDFTDVLNDREISRHAFVNDVVELPRPFPPIANVEQCASNSVAFLLNSFTLAWCEESVSWSRSECVSWYVRGGTARHVFLVIVKVGSVADLRVRVVK